MSLDARIAVRLERLDLDVDVTVAAGEVVAILGPSGAGKTTILRAIAGLVPLTRGRVALDGTVFEDTAERVYVPAGAPRSRRGLSGRAAVPASQRARQRRRGSLLHRLVAPGGAGASARVAGAPRHRRARGGDAGGALRRAGAARGAGARARHASRACCCSTSRSRRSTSRRAPRCAASCVATSTSFAGHPSLVTHDPIEALALADRLVVLEAGRIVQAGSSLGRHRATALALRRRFRRRELAARPGARRRRSCSPTAAR